MTSVIIDNIIDSIVSPETTGQPIPPEIRSATVALGYIAGNPWLTFEPYEKARPDLVAENRVIPVSLTYAVPRGVKRCMYDMEKGGGNPANIGAFADRVDRSEPFYLYTFASAGASMLAWARGFGYVQGRDFYYVSAHATGKKHMCAPDVCGYPRSDWTQYLFAGSYDKSCGYDYAIPDAAKPKPVDQYVLFPTFVGDKSLPFGGNEQLTVKHVDGALEAWHAKGLFHDYLKGPLRAYVKTYRDRCMRVAKFLPPDFRKPNPHPTWADSRHLGARWQALNLRLKRIDAIRPAA